MTMQPQGSHPARQSSSTHSPPMLLSSPRSFTEERLADNVTCISRQLLDSFAFAQVDHLVADLTHMRQYLVSKLPDPETRPLTACHTANDFFSPPKHPKLTAIPEYKGVLYGRRCLSTQKLIIEYLLGRCLQQMQTCLHELEQTEAASSLVESSADYVLRVGKEHGVPIDADGLDAESCMLYQKVRSDLHELGEEMRFLDGAREITEVFQRDPEAFLRRPR